MSRILLLEDDATLGRGVRFALETEGVRAELCVGLAEARALLAQGPFDLLVLDVNLSEGSDLETDIVMGLESGADDYVTKPFSLAILRARVNAQLRRGAPPQTEVFTQDGFTFDFAAMEFSKNGVSVELSKTEQKLLRLLVANRGTTLRRETLIDRVWTDGAAYVDENALSVTVKRLRGKLEETPSMTKEASRRLYEYLHKNKGA